MKKLYILILFLFPVFCNAQKIYVDVNNNTGVENGTAKNPFKSLWDGIYASNVGDTLFIRNGVYVADPATPAFLLKDGVITMGEDSSKTIVQGDFGNNLATMTHYTELSNLKCREVGFATGAGSAKVVIRDCVLDWVGFASGGGYEYHVENCTLKSGVSNSSGNNFIYVRNNKITNGFIKDIGSGPEGIESHFFENNEMFYPGNIDSYHNSAIGAASSSITIKNNKIRATGKSSGIYAICQAPTNIIGNTIELDQAENPTDDNFNGIYNNSGQGVVTGNKISGGKIGYYSNSGATLFADNEITNANYGFFSNGAEEVRNNKITHCNYGMVLGALRGPISENIVIDNDSIGIWLLTSVDLGGGNQNGIGRNIIRGNGYFDMKISGNYIAADTLYINNNVWDHQTKDSILQFDILNESVRGKLLVNLESIISKPLQPELTSPANAALEADTSLTLSWQTSAGAEFYKTQIAKDAGFENIICNVDSISVLYYSIDSLDFNATYYWRCAATNLAGESDWSEKWQFKTKVATGTKNTKADVPELNIYPNPANGKLRIQSSRFKVESSIFELYDLTGKKLLEKQIVAGTETVEIDVSNLACGVYFCTMRTDKKSSTKKLIIK